MTDALVTSTADVLFDNGSSYGSKEASSGGLLFTPDYRLGAESATLGQTYSGPASDQWTDASGNTIAQNTEVFRGDQAWRYKKDAGSDGFGSWGGRKTLSSNLVKGDIIHCQFSTYMPTDFDWTVVGAGSRLKYFRIHIATAASANVGYHDLYIHNGTFDGPANDGRLAYHSEIVSDVDAFDGENLVKNVWETIEMQVTLDDVSVDSGGAGRVRVWRNKGGIMTLIGDITDKGTLNSATDICDAALMFTYWNGTKLDEEICYGDDVIIQLDQSKLVETDAAGNKIIGGL